MVMIIGHRGARNLWPENSLEGFRKAAGLGIDGIELDVHMTRDGRLAVIHDPTLERTTSGAGSVGARTLAELQGIALKGSAESIPSLDDTLALLAPTGLELHLEIKTDLVGNRYEGLEEGVIAAVDRHGLRDRAILTCFAPEVLEIVRGHDSGIGVLASVDRRSAEMLGGIEPAIARFARIEGCLVAVEKGLLVHTLDLWTSRFGADRLGAWVTNEAPDLDYWMRQPIRQITTDNPDVALDVRTAHAAAGGKAIAL